MTIFYSCCSVEECNLKIVTESKGYNILYESENNGKKTVPGLIFCIFNPRNGHITFSKVSEKYKRNCFFMIIYF